MPTPAGTLCTATSHCRAARATAPPSTTWHRAAYWASAPPEAKASSEDSQVLRAQPLALQRRCAGPPIGLQRVDTPSVSTLLVAATRHMLLCPSLLALLSCHSHCPPSLVLLSPHSSDLFSLPPRPYPLPFSSLLPVFRCHVLKFGCKGGAVLVQLAAGTSWQMWWDSRLTGRPCKSFSIVHKLHMQCFRHT